MFAHNGAELFLVGRSLAKLETVRDDLMVRGAKRVQTSVLDLTELNRHDDLVNSAISNLGGLDAVLIAHGTLGDQKACEQSASSTMNELTINCTSTISLLTILANYFEKKRSGCLAVITSVAGDRGRKSNYVYGTAKGALNVFLQGLRHRLFEAGINVITIKPGFVDTPMTASIPKNALFVQPETVARGIYDAMRKGRDVVYLPWFWRPIMGVVRNVPGFVFNRLNL